MNDILYVRVCEIVDNLDNRCNLSTMATWKLLWSHYKV